MEASPLSQQSRPESFQPKVVGLYESLFNKVCSRRPLRHISYVRLICEQDDDEVEKSEGFWQELFLLKPEPKALKDILTDLSTDDLLHLQAHPQQLLIRAIRRVRDGVEPSDENALDVGPPTRRQHGLIGLRIRP